LQFAYLDRYFTHLNGSRKYDEDVIIDDF